MSSCCREGVPEGEDIKFFRELDQALLRLENRDSDKIVMDLSIQSKKRTYQRLLDQAARLKLLLR